MVGPQGLMPGDYTVPFEFQLPSYLPASFLFSKTNIEAKPKAKVKYHIKVRMVTRLPSLRPMQYKQVLIIREAPPAVELMINQNNRLPIRTWCCINQGVSEITGRFEKNMYCPNEKVKADAIINNAQCNLNVTDIRLAIEQEVTITCDGHTWKEMYTIAEKLEAGVMARFPTPEYRYIEIDLSTIQFPVPDMRRKKNKPISMEDKFMLSQAQPVTHGMHVTNEYFVAIRMNFNGCTCCSTLPMSRIPLVITPMINPACYGFQIPADYQPQVQPMYQIVFA